MFYDKFTELCFTKKLSPSAAVQDMGLSASAITRWKRGIAPRGSTLALICSYFDVEPSYFSDDDEQKKNSPETVSGIETAQMLELIQLFDAASPEIRQAALAVLRSAEVQK